MLSSISACTFGAPVAVATITVPTPSSGSSSADTDSAASWAWYTVSATTSAYGLPDVVDLVAIEDRAPARDHIVRSPVAQSVSRFGQVVGRPNGDDAGHRFRRRSVDGPDVRVGEAGAAARDVDESTDRDGACEARTTSEQPVVTYAT